MQEGLTRVSVTDVRVAIASTPGVEAGMVVLAEDEAPHRSIQIVIGQHEARAIQTAWSGTAQRRPSTWDLLVTTVSLLEGRIDRAVITAVEEGRHFFANLEVEANGERKVISTRPSDAIAVVLRAYGAEMYVAEQVWADLGLGQPAVDN